MGVKKFIPSLLTVGVIAGTIMGVALAASAKSNVKEYSPVTGYPHTNDSTVRSNDGKPYSLISENSMSIESKSTEYKKNKNGKTYGSSLYAESEEGEPDLIEAYGIDGTLGYVLSSDLNEQLPKTPQEALAKQKLRETQGPRHIPLYDVDGETVIGEFVVSAGTAVTK
ncbi:hypothetical protein [Paenibacillus sp. GCM10027626]|uniref:hypothetical protein n=1 Tax=Paenibacillus sp. GCM10027626 TaxID=3273411 RepID=UPI003631CF84